MTDGGGACKANTMPVQGDHYTTGAVPAVSGAWPTTPTRPAAVAAGGSGTRNGRASSARSCTPATIPLSPISEAMRCLSARTALGGRSAWRIACSRRAIAGPAAAPGTSGRRRTSARASTPPTRRGPSSAGSGTGRFGSGQTVQRTLRHLQRHALRRSDHFHLEPERQRQEGRRREPRVPGAGRRQREVRPYAGNARGRIPVQRASSCCRWPSRAMKYSRTRKPSQS